MGLTNVYSKITICTSYIENCDLEKWLTLYETNHPKAMPWIIICILIMISLNYALWYQFMYTNHNLHTPGAT